MSDTKSGRYRHYKGDEYTVIGVAQHSESEELLVVYRPEYGEGRLWVRPLPMFNQLVDTPTGPVQRFTYIGAEDPQGE